MKFFLKAIIFLMLFISVYRIQAQDSLSPVKFRRNAIKFGVSLTWSKYFLVYEHAFSKNISFGGAASYALGNFSGYTGTIFSRYYFKGFNEKGFFVEARGSYSHYDPYVCSGYYLDPPPSLGSASNRIYFGKHRADIHYWSAGLSGGYKFFCNERVFFEFMGGIHYGKVTMASDDVFFSRDWFGRLIQTDDVYNAFQNSGPNFPLHFMCTFGLAF